MMRTQTASTSLRMIGGSSMSVIVVEKITHVVWPLAGLPGALDGGNDNPDLGRNACRSSCGQR